MYIALNIIFIIQVAQEVPVAREDPEDREAQEVQGDPAVLPLNDRDHQEVPAVPEGLLQNQNQENPEGLEARVDQEVQGDPEVPADQEGLEDQLRNLQNQDSPRRPPRLSNQENQEVRELLGDREVQEDPGVQEAREARVGLEDQAAPRQQNQFLE